MKTLQSREPYYKHSSNTTCEHHPKPKTLNPKPHANIMRTPLETVSHAQREQLGMWVWPRTSRTFHTSRLQQTEPMLEES